MKPLIGQTLANRYYIDAPLGRGGMAEVYQAWDQQRATYLALKLLREDLSEALCADLGFLHRFRTAGQTLARLQHPNIVRYYGLEQDGPLAFLLMDYVDGQTLRSELFHLKGQPMPLDRVQAILQPVCATLQYAHSLGMVHGDLKPSNLMLEKSGRVLVVDFGIARLIQGAAPTPLTGAGAPAYLAPEQVRGEPVTPQTDLYALGIILYELLTGGHPPFTGEHAPAAGPAGEKVSWEQVHYTPVSPCQFNSTIPPELDQAVMRCLEKDPARRFEGASTLFAHAFPTRRTAWSQSLLWS